MIRAQAMPDANIESQGKMFGSMPSETLSRRSPVPVLDYSNLPAGSILYWCDWWCRFACQGAHRLLSVSLWLLVGRIVAALLNKPPSIAPQLLPLAIGAASVAGALALSAYWLAPAGWERKIEARGLSLAAGVMIILGFIGVAIL